MQRSTRTDVARNPRLHREPLAAAAPLRKRTTSTQLGVGPRQVAPSFALARTAIETRERRELSIADLFPLRPAVHAVPVAPPSLIPRSGGGDEEVDLQPPGPAGGGTGGSAPAPAAADGCDRPRSMEKRTSGAFLGGLTIGSYFPDIAGRGYPAAAGPFDLGNRAGSSVQLIGVIASPCDPSRFSLAQTYSVTRARVNGTADPLEGTSGDDIVRSRRDATRAPFRQEFLGGGAAPLGYIVSMADPPSIPYSAATRSGELDVDFVSSLVGPGGRASVDWSISVRITDGSVTRNTVS